MLDWNKYPNFSKSEFDCKETGKNLMTPAFMDKIQQIRTLYGRPMIVSSGYRDRSHSVERNKPAPGEHVLGLAGDFRVYGLHAFELVKVAIDCGIKRIGIHQKGDFDKRFIHIGMGDKHGFPPTIWSY